MDLVWFEVPHVSLGRFLCSSDRCVQSPGIEGLQQKSITKDLKLKGLVSQQHSTRSALRGDRCATLVGNHGDFGGTFSGDPLVNIHFAIEYGPVEILDLPMKKIVIFHSYVAVYQRVLDDSSWLAFQAASWLFVIHPTDLRFVWIWSYNCSEIGVPTHKIFEIEAGSFQPQPADVTNHKQLNWKLYKIYTLDYLDCFTLNLPTHSLIIHHAH